MNGNLRLTHHGREYEFGLGEIERKGDRVRVSLRYGDDTEGHFLIYEEMGGRVKTVSSGSASEVRMRIEKEQRRLNIMAALHRGDDVSGHAVEEESFTGEVEGAEVAGHGIDDAETAELGLAAAAAWVTLAQADSEAGTELPPIG